MGPLAFMNAQVDNLGTVLKNACSADSFELRKQEGERFHLGAFLNAMAMNLLDVCLS